ncbi:MAG: M48 family metalloprotease [Desulfonatronovibrionaceae bacterium]
MILNRPVCKGFSLLFLLLYVLWLPVHARAGFGEFTLKEEAELGEKFSRMIRSRFELVDDPEITGYIRYIVDRIEKNMPPQPFSLKPNVINNNSMNAFATVAGYMFVFSGLILKVEHEDELAAVIAHELAHVSERHVARNIEKSQWLSLGSILGVLAGVFIGSQSSEGSEAIVAGSLAGSQSALLKYSRDHERQADQLGMSFLVDSGYNPECMVSAFDKIRKASRLGAGGGNIPSYLSTHPGVNERLGYLENRVDRMSAEYRKREYEDHRLHRIQTLLRARYSDPSTALRHFQSGWPSPDLSQLGAGITLSRLNRIEEAVQVFEKALSGNEDDALFLREAGRFYYSYDELDQAAEYLQKAVFLSPRDGLALFYYARVLAEQNKDAQALSFLERVLKELPENPDVRRTLARVYARQKKMFDAHLQMAYSFLYSENRSNLRLYLEKLPALAETREQKEEVEDLEKEFKLRSKYW